MSRIGNKPIEIPKGVQVDLKGQDVKAKGPKGELALACHASIRVAMDSNVLKVENPTPDDRKAKQLHGTMRALIANMVNGVSSGFEHTTMDLDENSAGI